MKKGLLFLAILWLAQTAQADMHFHDARVQDSRLPQVRSWKAMRDQGIVKQDLDYSCGAASIATLLNQQYGQRPLQNPLTSSTFATLGNTDGNTHEQLLTHRRP